jgi:hypothetical protein
MAVEWPSAACVVVVRDGAVLAAVVEKVAEVDERLHAAARSVDGLHTE